MRLAFVVVSVCLLLGSLARAQPRVGFQAPLDTIEAHLEQARFRQALDAAHRQLARDDLPARERNRSLELKAVAQLALRERSGARDTLTALYARDPEHRPSLDLSPTIDAAFVRAREQAGATVPVSVEVGPLRPDRVLEAHVQGGDAVDSVQLTIQLPGETPTTLLMHWDGAGPARAKLPIVNLHPTEARLRVAALAPSGHVLGRFGTENEPYELDLPPIALDRRQVAGPAARAREAATPPTKSPVRPERVPDDNTPELFERWWFWPTVGAGILGVAGVVWIANGGADSGPSASLGEGRLR